jgi:peptide/nickel transport system permease protein
MTTFIIRRFIQGVVVLLLATFFIYSLLILTPGGPRDQINQMKIEAAGNKPINPKLIEYYEKLYGLNQPYPLNYLLWLFNPENTSKTAYNLQGEATTTTIGINLFGIVRGSGVLTGNLGASVSMDQGNTVINMIGQRLLNTLLLTGSALLIAILIALPIGIISSVRQYSRLDYTVTTLSFVGLSMPVFWLGLMLIIIFAQLAKAVHTQNGWEWLPYLPPGDTGQNSVTDRLYHLVLPVSVLASIQIAQLSRYVRSSMLEVLRQDYVRTAWAKGLQQRVVILKHALRNALIPVITIITLSLPGLLAGAILTETVFNYFGMGKLYYEALLEFDIPIVMGFLLIAVALIVLSNILADVLYGITDPRIKYS